MNTEQELQLCAEGCGWSRIEALGSSGDLFTVWSGDRKWSYIHEGWWVLYQIHAAAARMGWGVRIVKRADGTGFIVFTKPCVLGSYDAEWTDSAELPATITAFARVVEASREP